MRALTFAAALAALVVPAIAPAVAEDSLPHQKWSFSGVFGTFDRAAAQRGFQIYKDVCSNCHSLKEAYYRDLGGIGLTDEQIKAIAATITVPTIGEDGQPAERPALPSDHFKLPFPNDQAARAALNGALPPDLSVITKAREGGPDYVYAVLTGYGEPPAGMQMGAGMNYNKAFPGHQIAMPQPLQDDSVTYADGTKATLPQEAHDVVTFLTYISNPEMEERKRMGVKVLIFLALLTGVTYAVKRKVWSDVH
ncbi:MAG: cytochrome c1 [Alphaproteobacteria bacterium]|nr:cytochrome c1 [Alphaproteobacteria bacterium]